MSGQRGRPPSRAAPCSRRIEEPRGWWPRQHGLQPGLQRAQSATTLQSFPLQKHCISSRACARGLCPHQRAYPAGRAGRFPAFLHRFKVTKHTTFLNVLLLSSSLVEGPRGFRRTVDSWGPFTHDSQRLGGSAPTRAEAGFDSSVVCCGSAAQRLRASIPVGSRCDVYVEQASLEE
jgi:hypothetical protein